MGKIKKQKQYTKGVKLETVKGVTDQGMKVSEAGKVLEVTRRKFKLTTDSKHSLLTQASNPLIVTAIKRHSRLFIEY